MEAHSSWTMFFQTPEFSCRWYLIRAKMPELRSRGRGSAGCGLAEWPCFGICQPKVALHSLQWSHSSSCISIILNHPSGSKWPKCISLQRFLGFACVALAARGYERRPKQCWLPWGRTLMPSIMCCLLWGPSYHHNHRTDFTGLEMFREDVSELSRSVCIARDDHRMMAFGQERRPCLLEMLSERPRPMASWLMMAFYAIFRLGSKFTTFQPCFVMIWDS